MRCFVSVIHRGDKTHIPFLSKHTASIQNTHAPLVLLQGFVCILHSYHTRKKLILFPGRKMPFKILIHWIHTKKQIKTYMSIPRDKWTICELYLESKSRIHARGEYQCPVCHHVPGFMIKNCPNLTQTLSYSTAHLAMDAMTKSGRHIFLALHT